MKIFGLNLLFGDPAAADIVIFDEVNSQYLRSAISEGHSVAILKVRSPRDLRIGFKIVANFICTLISYRSVPPAANRNAVREALSRLWILYLKAWLSAIKPKAVVTSIDNSGAFHRLSRICRQFPMIAIQNGARMRYASSDSPGYYLQHLICWGAHEMKLFPEFGYQVEYFYPTGSLLAGLYFDRTLTTRKHDLLIVSTWRGNIGFPEDVRDTMRSMEVMDRLLSRYISLRGVKAAVVLRAQRDGEHWEMPGIGNEHDYYKNIYGGTIEIIEADFVARNIYPVMQQSSLILSCLSSALVEAFGIGRKVLYCNFTGTDAYHRDLAPSIVTDGSDWDTFSGLLDGLRAQPPNEYQAMHKAYSQYVMSFPPDWATHKLIAKTIDQIISDFQ